MPAKKRTASKQVSKRQRTMEPVKSELDLKLDSLVAALGNEDYPVVGPASNRQMLVDGAPFALSEFVDDRHTYQTDMIGMIQQSLAHIRTHLTARCDEQQRLMDSAESTKATLAAALEGCEKDREEKETHLETAKTELIAKQTLTKEAKDALATAKKNQSELDLSLDVKNKELETFRVGQDEWFAALLGAPDKKLLKQLTPVLKSLNLDDSFMTQITATLAKNQGDRGMFDKIAVDTTVDTFTKRRADITADIAATTESGAHLIADTTAKELLLTEAQMIQEQHATQRDTAKENLKTAQAAQKEAEKALNTHEEDVEKASERKEEASSELERFGVVEENFVWTRERRPVVEEEEKVVEEDQEMAEAPTAEATEETEVVMEEVAPVEAVPEAVFA